MRALILAVSLLLATVVGAHHQGGHRVLALGVSTVIPIEIGVCDLEEQAMAVVTAQERDGFVAAQEVWFQYTRVPGYGGQACGRAEGLVTPLSVIWHGPLEWSDGSVVDTYVLEIDLLMRDLDGVVKAFRQYATIPDVRIVSEDELLGPGV